MTPWSAAAISEFMAKANTVFPRRSDQRKYELNRLALESFLSDSLSLHSHLHDRLDHLRSLTASPVIIGFLYDWENIVNGDVQRLAAVFHSGTDYAVAMLETSPLSILITQTEREEVFRNGL